MGIKRKHIDCPQCNGKGNIMIDACEHDWKLIDDWSLTLGKQHHKCRKCGESSIG